MGKLITVVILVILGVYLYKRMTGQIGGRRAPPPEEKVVEDMVRCKTCGVNLPRSEAIMSQGRFYCCDEHRRRDS